MTGTLLLEWCLQQGARVALTVLVRRYLGQGNI